MSVLDTSSGASSEAPENIGLGATAKADWPKLSKKDAEAKPIDLLANKETHDRVLNYLNDRLKRSELEMSRFYGRWRVNEMKYQAFIDLPDWEKQLKDLTDKGEPPKAVSIVVPYTFATISTVVTYLIQVFAGRDPMLTVNADKSEFVKGAKSMETVLNYQATHTHLVRHLFQFLNDVTCYGVGVMRCQWKVDKKMRTSWITKPQGGGGLLSMLTGGGQSKAERERKKQLVYEGSDICSIDPFMFFPDPRVPMSEVARRGEYVFWRTYEGKHMLLKMEADGTYKYVDKAPPMAIPTPNDGLNMSARGLLAGGEGTPGVNAYWLGRSDIYQMDQGTIEIIPAELGLGTDTTPQKFVFTWLNRAQIVQAERLDLDHDMHPVCVSEPFTMGYGFGQPGLIDYIGPMQDLMSWFINSHVDNVRTVLNNMLVVDPSRIEMQDLKEPGAGKLIRLKRAAYGTDVNAAVKQLEVSDVTGSHVTDFSMLLKLSDMLGSVSDNLRGQQADGGRKTATEVRSAMDAGTSRLASLAKRISCQGFVDMTEMMSMNTQQLISDEFYLDVVGKQAAGEEAMRITPEMLCGDFNYPIHDGTMPMDKVAMVDVWKEILMGIMQDPTQQLQRQFNIVNIFKYVAELGGARNIDDFVNEQQPMPQVNMTAMPDEQAAAEAKKGNLQQIPKGNGSGQTPGLPGTPPAQRAV